MLVAFVVAFVQIMEFVKLQIVNLKEILRATILEEYVVLLPQVIMIVI